MAPHPDPTRPGPAHDDPANDDPTGSEPTSDVPPSGEPAGSDQPGSDPADGDPAHAPAAPALGDADRRALRAHLLAEHERTAAQAAALARTFDELVAAADLEPPDDEHDPDGTTAYERAQVTSLERESRARLAALSTALADVEDGAYGTCERCGATIALERLRAVPGTRRCVACAAGRAPTA